MLKAVSTKQLNKYKLVFYTSLFGHIVIWQFYFIYQAKWLNNLYSLDLVIKYSFHYLQKEQVFSLEWQTYDLKFKYILKD